MISHHPADTTLLSTASGTLLPLHREVVAVHLARCADCRAAVEAGEEIGGALLDAMPPAALGDKALAAALARLDEAAAHPRASQTEAPLDLSPKALERLIETGPWRAVGLGIKLMPLVPRDATGTRLDLIRVAGGTALPRHDHTGPEMTCVLRGGYADATGQYNAGDVAEGDVGLDHQPRALAGAECICLIATTGRLRAKSLIARLLQPIFGI